MAVLLYDAACAMSKSQIREAIYSATCDFCGTEKIDPINWIQFYIRTRIGFEASVDMCDSCFNRTPVRMQNILNPEKKNDI